MYATAYRVERRRMVMQITTEHPTGKWVMEDELAEVPTQSEAELTAAKRLLPGERQVRVQVPDGVAPGDRISFTISDDDRQFAIDVPSYLNRAATAGRMLMAAVLQTTPDDSQGGSDGTGARVARLMEVMPIDDFLYSFVLDPNGGVAAGLIQLTESGASVQPCSRVELAGTAAGRTRFEWNSTTVQLRDYGTWQELNRGF